MWGLFSWFVSAIFFGCVMNADFYVTNEFRA